MDWEKILWAGLIGIMILLLLPQAQARLQQSRETNPRDWYAVILPLALVVGFVTFLVMLVR